MSKSRVEHYEVVNFKGVQQAPSAVGGGEYVYSHVSASVTIDIRDDGAHHLHVQAVSDHKKHAHVKTQHGIHGDYSFTFTGVKFASDGYASSYESLQVKAKKHDIPLVSEAAFLNAECEAKKLPLKKGKFSIFCAPEKAKLEIVLDPSHITLPDSMSYMKKVPLYAALRLASPAVVSGVLKKKEGPSSGAGSGVDGRSHSPARK